ADHARLIGEVHILAGGSRGNGGSGYRIRLVAPARAEDKCVAALASTCEDRVNQVRRRGTGRAARGDRAQVRERRRELAIAGGVSDARCVQRTQRAHRGSLVGGDLRPQQVGDGDGGDNQNDRHHDQKFYKRETLLSIAHDVTPHLFKGTCVAFSRAKDGVFITRARRPLCFSTLGARLNPCEEFPRKTAEGQVTKNVINKCRKMLFIDGFGSLSDASAAAPFTRRALLLSYLQSRSRL